MVIPASSGLSQELLAALQVVPVVGLQLPEGRARFRFRIRPAQSSRLNCEASRRVRLGLTFPPGTSQSEFFGRNPGVR